MCKRSNLEIPPWKTTFVDSWYLRSRKESRKERSQSGSPRRSVIISQKEMDCLQRLGPLEVLMWRTILLNTNITPRGCGASLKNLTRQDVNNYAFVHHLREGDELITGKLNIAEHLNFCFVKQLLKFLRNLPSNKAAHVSLRRIN